MKAVILAAGLGSRLRPITNSVPKCMVKVNNTTIIEQQINNLKENGVLERSIYIVGGYKADVLKEFLLQKYPMVNFINNARYDETNNMYSLYLLKEKIKGEDFLLMNGDVFFDSSIITGIMSKNISQIACDYTCYLEESMKIQVSADGKIKHISKKINEDKYEAVSIDVYRINQFASNNLFTEIENIIIKNKDENSWTEIALDSIFSTTEFTPYNINGRWFEIDTLEDLQKAEIIFHK